MTELLLIAACVLVTAVGVIAWGIFRSSARLFGPVRTRLSPEHASANRVALTFDDGPCPGSTDRILDILAQHGVRATFFVIGRHAERHPELLRRIAEEGHAIGNHTFDHSRLGLFRTWAYWSDQIDRTQHAIESATGLRPTLFRCPMGFKTPPIMRGADRAGLAVWAWSRRGYDAGLGSRETILRAARAMRPGDVLLLHDGRDPASSRRLGLTPDTLPDLLEMLRSAGLEPVRLDEPQPA